MYAVVLLAYSILVLYCPHGIVVRNIILSKQVVGDNSFCLETKATQLRRGRESAAALEVWAIRVIHIYIRNCKHDLQFVASYMTV